MEAVPGNGAGVGPGSSFPLGTAPLGCKDLLCHRGHPAMHRACEDTDDAGGDGQNWKDGASRPSG